MVNNKKLSLFGWMFILLLIYFFTKNKTGYSIVYNSLFVILVFLLLTSYNEINKLIYSKTETIGG